MVWTILVFFSSFCEQNLHVKPAAVRCHRVGKSESGKVQPLLVVLNNGDAVADLLEQLHGFRKSTEEKAKLVFINRDLTSACSLPVACYTSFANRTNKT